MQLTSPIGTLPKIGPKYKALLQKLEINTIEDLLYHFPFRYEDLSEIKHIEDLLEGETVTIQATLDSIENIFTKYRKKITKAKASDHTGSIEITWFNQHYIKRSLKPDTIYNFSGKVGSFNNKLTLIAPEWEEQGSEYSKSLNTGRLVPVYPETAGISSKWLRTRINDVLGRNLVDMGLIEFLPVEITHKHNLVNIKDGLKHIHFPDDLPEAEKARERFAFEELFLELLNVERRKHEWGKTLDSHSMKTYYDELHTFINKLPFELTEGQNNAVGEILEDLRKSHPMNRLLEGDVGTGKTIVAVITAYLAHLNGLKTLYMAPTEILAKQHYQTFTEFLNLLGDKAPKLQLKTGSTKPKGVWDILIGTHAILFDDGYEDIGLVVIDEQHRFGVEQRGKIIDLGRGSKVPHLLTMTATPIPRTLALTIYGDLAISALKEHPNNHRQVKTRVVPENQRTEAYKWIRERNEPTFIVCPLIEESEHEIMENVKAAEAEYETLRKGIFKDLSVGLLHGRMKSKEKEEVVDKFRAGEIQVLVSTPVIEVGIDIPDATVIVIESAERYGLASLHQLRGRVGRREKEGFCFVFMSNSSKRAFARLKNLETVHNGLELAEIDMDYRGHGDIFGTMQHGFKEFKVANLENLEMLENAKLAAQEFYPQINTYPELKDKLNTRKGDDTMAPAN